MNHPQAPKKQTQFKPKQTQFKPKQTQSRNNSRATIIYYGKRLITDREVEYQTKCAFWEFLSQFRLRSPGHGMSTPKPIFLATTPQPPPTLL